MALRPHPLGERLVGDLADDVAAEPPPAAVELEACRRPPARSTSLSENSCRIALANRRRASWSRRTRARRRCRPWPAVSSGSWSRRAAISARSEPGSSDSVGARWPPSAASSTRNSGLPPPRSTSSATSVSLGLAAAAAFEHPADERRCRPSGQSGPSGTCSTSGRSTGGGQAMSPSGRWPVTSRNGRSASERTTTASRSRSTGRPTAGCRPTAPSCGSGRGAHHLGDAPATDVADAGRRRAVERRRVAEQVARWRRGSRSSSVVAGLRGPTARRRARSTARRTSSAVGLGIEAEQCRQAGDDRRPHARLAVRRARRAQHDRLVLERAMISSARRGLAGTRPRR